jgi:hypothetical protein
VYSEPDVTWACVWCLVSWNITKSKFVNHPIVNAVFCDKMVIQGATDLLQQTELCGNELFIPHFI